MTTENFRFYTKVRTALNIQARIIHDELYSVYGDQAPSLRTMERWSKLFREGREEIEDEARHGRSITETTSENIKRIRLLIDDDSCVTIEELQEKVTARYILKDLTDFQRAERVRICKENLSKFQQGSWRLCDIITGDESWFYHKQIGRKSSNADNNETPHIHEPNMDDVFIQQFKAQVIKRVRSELVTPGVIHSEELAKANMPPSAMANLPIAQSMRKSMV
ncbi:unnamed protein product [Rotaria sordida]|uniref:Mos1 transposase HTH domain-containing protein n=1 Tax=Rotaria sordida TaxID=392033 RepID=A0A819GIR4_9BILA|nr:unnamed protein product [Rotaria sordida]